MIKFFRTVRHRFLKEKKVTNYLIYAIGEIILVVIGILIALQINNWNEARKNELQETVLVKNIVEDLKLDSIHMQEALNGLANQLEVTDRLIKLMLDASQNNDFSAAGLIRYSSDFRPISQRNHSESVSNLENENTREMLQNYFLIEDRARDIFLEYENIIHHQIRPYMREVGMHNLAFLYDSIPGFQSGVFLDFDILSQQLKEKQFQQLLFERRLKTNSFQILLGVLQDENKALIESLNLNTK